MLYIFQILFFLVFFIQLYFLGRNYLKMVMHVWQNEVYKHDGISIIIACKNDEEKLHKNLAKILSQKHALVEVIVVDDASTQPIVLPDHDRLVMVRLDASKGKREALKKGVEISTYSWILFTDADCEPASDFWAGEMLSNSDENTDLVLGYGAYKKTSYFLSNLIQMDTLSTVSTYMSAALRGSAYMGVGRNLLVRKSAFMQAISTLDHGTHLYGDDDLLVQCLATKTNTRICLHPRGFTYSEAADNLKEWFLQKRRHLSAGHFYKRQVLLELGIERLSNWMMWGLFIFVLLPLNIYFLPLFCLMIYAAYKCYIFAKLKERFKSPLNLEIFPVWDLLYSFCLFTFTITSTVYSSKKWR